MKRCYLSVLNFERHSQNIPHEENQLPCQEYEGHQWQEVALFGCLFLNDYSLFLNVCGCSVCKNL